MKPSSSTLNICFFPITASSLSTGSETLLPRCSLVHALPSASGYFPIVCPYPKSTVPQVNILSFSWRLIRVHLTLRDLLLLWTEALTASPTSGPHFKPCAQFLSFFFHPCSLLQGRPLHTNISILPTASAPLTLQERKSLFWISHLCNVWGGQNFRVPPALFYDWGNSVFWTDSKIIEIFGSIIGTNSNHFKIYIYQLHTSYSP